MLLPMQTSNGNFRYGLQTMISELQRVNIYPSESGFDAIIIGLMVYIADMKISRRKQSQDSWTREITLSIPVYDSKWMNHRNTIERMLKFLTGDIWTLEFSKREERFAIRIKKSVQINIELRHYFGGMDSLIAPINYGTRTSNSLVSIM